MLEAKLAAATEPDSVKMPPGYEVVPEVKEGQPSYHLPDELQLPESLGAALAVLEGVSFAAVGVHVLEPVVAAHKAAMPHPQCNCRLGRGQRGSIPARGGHLLQHIAAAPRHAPGAACAVNAAR